MIKHNKQQILLMVSLIVSLILSGGCASPSSNNQADAPSNIYESFTSNTTYADILKALGKPDAERAFPRAEVVLPTKLICYGSRNICIVVVNLKHFQEEANNAYYNYVGTIKINPSEVAHFVKSEEGGDTRPLMEFFRGQVAYMWANAEKEVSSKNIPQASEVKDEDALRQLISSVNGEITYEHLKKNADRYSGEVWAFTGKIVQIQESGGQTTALVSLDAWGNKLMYVRADFTTDFVEKNQIYVIGYLAGNYSYQSVAGWNMTVPTIEARAILKPNEAARYKSGKGSRK